MDYRPNRDGAHWFAHEVYPRVRERHPNTAFLIVGREPTRTVRALGKLSGVVVTGAVDDVHRYFLNAAVSVAPLRMGSGTRLKILEAVALGTPTVATAIGVEGLDLERGRQILIADTPEDFARCVVFLLENPGAAREMGQCGRRFVLDHYDWTRLVPALESELEARA